MQTQTLCRDDDRRKEVELEIILALQPEVVVVIVAGGNVAEDGGAVLLTQQPRQVSLQDVVGSCEAGVEHLCPTPASLPDGFTRVVQALIPRGGQAESAGDDHAGPTYALYSLRQEDVPLLA